VAVPTKAEAGAPKVKVATVGDKTADAADKIAGAADKAVIGTTVAPRKTQNLSHYPKWHSRS